MVHKVERIDNLMYKGCEPHWKCTICGICIPFHCYSKTDIEEWNAQGKRTNQNVNETYIS